MRARRRVQRLSARCCVWDGAVVPALSTAQALDANLYGAATPIRRRCIASGRGLDYLQPSGAILWAIEA